jgi:putative copper export protein
MGFVRKSTELATLQSTTLLDALFVYIQSSVGTFSALKLIGALIFVLLFGIYRKKILRLPTIGLYILFAVLFGILAMQAYVSHAAASFFYPMTSVFITLVHLAAKELIVGGLFVLMACMVFFINTNRNFLTSCVRFYDVVAAAALLLAVISGAYITWLHLKKASNLVHTQWGELFLILLLCTVVLGMLRIFHQFIVSRNLDTKPSLSRIFMVTLGIEVGLACFVLFFSGYIAITTPPFTVEAYTYKEIVEQNGTTTKLTVHPYEVGSMLVEFIKSGTAEPVVPKAVIITAENVTADVGPNVLSTTKRFDGGYVFPRNELSPSGEWKLHVVAQQEQGYDVNASFTIDYPSAVDESKYTDDVRRFDRFALIILCIGIAGALFAAIMIAAAMRAVRAQAKTALTEDVPVSVSRSLLISILLVCTVAGLLTIGWSLFGESDLKKMCERDGHQFVQSFPTRDFEATSPNAQNGCLVHEGHFHIIDEREYITWKENWK